MPVYLSRMIRIGDLRLRWGIRRSRRRLVNMSNLLTYDEAENADHPFRDVNSFDWGLTTSFGIEVNNWVMNLGYDLSLGDEGGNYKIDGDNFSLYEVRSVGANYNTMSLTVGYKFKL